MKNTERQQKKDLKKQMKKQQIEEQNKAHYKKGQVLKLSGMPSGEQEMSIDDLKKFFEPYGTPAFAMIDGTEVWDYKAYIKFFVK